MRQLDDRRVVKPSDQRRVVPIHAERLSYAQKTGWECIFCGEPVSFALRKHAAYLGGDKLYACTVCARSYRVPNYPEPGSV